MKKCRLGDLRKIKLPAKDASEEDASIRKNQESEHPDSLKLVVPDSIYKRIPKDEPPAPKKPAA